MSTSLATLLCVLGVLGLFYLNRDTSVRTSGALWIPVVWFWIGGSRSVSIWLSGANPTSSADTMMDGNPTDRIVFQVLIILGLIILVRRGHLVFSIMADNWPIVLYYSFCLLSVAWSDYPDVSIRRWIKATADIIMPLVVVTDAQPVAAIRRLFSRVGFIILPGSVLFIKYYPQLGRSYDSWTGEPFNTGLATNKNMLGVITFAYTLGACWQVLRLWREPNVENRNRQLLAQCTALVIGLWLLMEAHSSTAGTCFWLAASLMVLTGLRRIRDRPSAVHQLVLTILIVGGLIKLTGADTAVLQVMGKDPTLTGRTDIWALVLSMAPNALVGAGFESFWLGPRLLKIWAAFPHLHLNEAHNGYLEVYLNLGVVGVALVVLILIDGYRRSVATFRIDPTSASLMLGFVVCSVMYSYTEAGFRMLDITWTFPLLVIFAASRISQLPGNRAPSSTPPVMVSDFPIIPLGVRQT